KKLSEFNINYDSLPKHVQFALTRLRINPGDLPVQDQIRNVLKQSGSTAGTEEAKIAALSHWLTPVIRGGALQAQDSRKPVFGAVRVAQQAVYLDATFFHEPRHLPADYDCITHRAIINY